MDPRAGRLGRCTGKLIVLLGARDDDMISIDDRADAIGIGLQPIENLAERRERQADREKMGLSAGRDHRHDNPDHVLLDDRAEKHVRDHRPADAHGLLLVGGDVGNGVRGQRRPPRNRRVDRVPVRLRIAQHDLDVELTRNFNCLTVKALKVPGLQRMRARQHRKQVLRADDLAVDRGRDLAHALPRVLFDLRALRLGRKIGKPAGNQQARDQDNDDERAEIGAHRMAGAVFDLSVAVDCQSPLQAGRNVRRYI